MTAPPDAPVPEWQAHVDVHALARWMDAQGLGTGPIESERALSGGTQNIMLRFTRGDRDYVLRRPPPHLRANSNETMQREMQVLAGLAGSDVPHAALVAACPQTDVLGCSFYLMEPVEGFNATVRLPALHASDPTIRYQMGLALVDGLLSLARVDHRAAALETLGRADGFLERQVPRWVRQLDGYRQQANWPGPADIPGVSEVGAWLDRHRPAHFQPGLMHGDYHLANVMYRNDGPGLAAIVDWELATIGDPLLDLGLVMTTWPRANDPTSMKIEPWDGFPTSAELAAHYARHSDRDLSALRWYEVLACFKLGILLEGTYARACAGQADRRTGERFHARTRALFERALGLVTH